MGFRLLMQDGILVDSLTQSMQEYRRELTVKKEERYRLYQKYTRKIEKNPEYKFVFGSANFTCYRKTGIAPSY